MPAPLVIAPPPTTPLLGKGAAAPAPQPASRNAPSTLPNQIFSVPDAATAQPTAAATDTSAAPALRYHRVTVAEATLYPEPLPSLPTETEAAAGKNGQEAHGLERFLWGKQGFSFDSLLQSLNPLEYVPIVSSIYRHVTGDSIGAVASTVGGALIGGPIGAAASFASSVFESVTGDDVGGHIMTALFGDAKPDAGKPPAAGADTAVAAAGAASAVPPAPIPPGARELANLPWLSPGTATPGGADRTLSAGTAPDLQAAPVDAAAPPGGSAKAAPILLPSNGDGRPQVPSYFAQRMMEALDKYQAAAKLHEAPPASAVDIGG
jgi:hypothetical protein